MVTSKCVKYQLVKGKLYIMFKKKCPKFYNTHQFSNRKANTLTDLSCQKTSTLTDYSTKKACRTTEKMAASWFSNLKPGNPADFPSPKLAIQLVFESQICTPTDFLTKLWSSYTVWQNAFLTLSIIAYQVVCLIFLLINPANVS